MKPSKRTPNLNTAEKDEGDKVKRKIQKLERKLMSLEKEIEKWDRREVNFDEDENSAYLVKTRMVKCYMKFYKILCDLQKHPSANTGRPIHKKIPVENVAPCSQVNEAVFRYLNSNISKDSYYFPDFHDVLAVVENTNEKKELSIREVALRQMAKDLFERIVVILKRRRRKDFCVALPRKEIADPAEEDEDLAKKLEENVSKGKKEDDVIREYVEKQANTPEEEDLGDEDSDTDSEDEDGKQNVNDHEGGDDSDVQIVSDEEVSQTSENEVIYITEDNQGIISNKRRKISNDDSDIEIISVSDDSA